MHAPHRLTVAMCLGCGAIGRPGTCELGCGAEERLDLVPAEDHDELATWTRNCRARGERLRATVRPLTPEPPGDVVAAYRALQRAAHDALSDGDPPALPERARAFTTWWCPRCGGVDAPQPCIGICVWRPVGWVKASAYDALREEAEAVAALERALGALLRRVASVTPRPGQWERTWTALASVVPPDD